MEKKRTKVRYMNLGIVSLLFQFTQIFSQVNITTGSYFQNFGTAAIPAWTDNTTFSGWYIFNNATPQWGGEVNITAAAPTNTGKNYAYTCNGGNDRKIGSRASGGTGTCYFGVLLRNTTGLTIQSLLVSFTAFQMSLGGNTNTNPNTLAFEYIISAAPIAVNAGGGISVPSLDYVQTQFIAIANTGSQTQGFPCTVSANRSACITATIPNNSYILLRWVDIDDVANDPHFAIDDLSVAFDLTGATCTNFLPIELINFSASYLDNQVHLNWSTASESNNEQFTIERSSDGIYFIPVGKVKGAGNSRITKYYHFIDKENESHNTYYRLNQTDYSAHSTYSKIIVLRRDEKWGFEIFPNPSSNGEFVIRSEPILETRIIIEVLDYNGKKLKEQKVNETIEKLDLSMLEKGMYLIRYSNNGQLIYKKVMIN